MNTSDSQLIARVVDENLQAVRWVLPYHMAHQDEYRFAFKREHWDDRNANERDRRRIRPKSRALDAKLTHKLNRIMQSVGTISTRPVDEDPNGDAVTAEMARWFLTYRTGATDLHWRRKLKRAVQMAIGARAGCVWLDCITLPTGKDRIVPRLADPRATVWTPGFTDPDDLLTPWVDEHQWVPIEQAQATNWWKDTADLKGSLPISTPWMSFNPIQPVTAELSPVYGQGQPRWVRLIKRWYRYDDSRTERGGNEQKLPADKRYMACADHCGYEDHSQEGQSLPTISEQPCTNCGGPMVRVDKVFVPDVVLKNRQGKRLLIIAPDEGRIFYDGPWKPEGNNVTLRSVPVLWLTGYDLPLEPWGSSDTDRDWSYVTTLNAMMRRAYESVATSGGIIITGPNGLKKLDGAPFEFTDKPMSLAKVHSLSEPEPQFFQPRGVLTDIMPYAQMTGQELRADMGTSDFAYALGPQRSKDIAATTYKEMKSTGDVPADDMAENVNERLALFLGTWYDMERCVLTPDEAIRLRGVDGQEMFQRLSGEDMPDVDVLIEPAPDWNDFDNAKIQAVQTLASIPDPATREVLAEAAGMPVSVVRKLTAAQQAEAARVNAQQGMNGGQQQPPAAAAQPSQDMAGMAPAQ